MTTAAQSALLLAGFAVALSSACSPTQDAARGGAKQPPGQAAAAKAQAGEELATLAGGCFWCMEPPFERLPGVRSVVAGYTGGEKASPTYEEVSSGSTGHAEAVQITFDPAVIRYSDLLEVYWRSIDPTDAGGQFADRGGQYRPAIFVHSAAQREAAERSKRELEASGRFDEPIAVEIVDYRAFYPAEDYHQNYCETNPVRYTRYREGSGRAAFLERTWGEAAASLPKATGEVAVPPAGEPPRPPRPPEPSEPAAEPSGARGRSDR
jgi:methionine-S-sulfoxide reductase